MIIRDVNNYIAVYEAGGAKLKGCFEIDKEFHKDQSMRIVPIALKEYFVNGTPVSETIKGHKDIYDFCLRLKVNSKSTAQYQWMDREGFHTQDLARTTRYYISNNGGILIKDFGEGRTSGVNIGHRVTLFNKFEEKDMKDYDINYGFYINECNKIIDVIEESKRCPDLFGDFV